MNRPKNQHYIQGKTIQIKNAFFSMNIQSETKQPRNRCINWTAEKQ